MLYISLVIPPSPGSSTDIIAADKANLRGKVGFIFGGLCGLGTLWSWLFVPELKGRTFQEIDWLFQNNVSPRHMANFDIPQPSAGYLSASDLYQQDAQRGSVA